MHERRPLYKRVNHLFLARLIFTSVKGDRLEGFQLAIQACSPRLFWLDLVIKDQETLW